MKNILDTPISYYSSIHSTKLEKKVTLYEFYTMPESNHLAAQASIRQSREKAERSKLKEELLPAITPGGVWENRKDLIEYSGFIALDIDKDHNSHILNFGTLKQQIRKINVVAYCGFSVSGLGYLVLIPIKDPACYKQHWYALEKDFKSFGIIIDPAVKAPNNMRYFSHDAEAFINTKASIYLKKLDHNPPPPINRKIAQYSPGMNLTQDRIQSCIDQITAAGIDITGGYNQWITIGFSLASEYGEAGRSLFHSVSQFHPAYDYQETDRQYTNCLKSGYRNSIDPFFAYCRDHGILFNQIAATS